MTFFGRVICLKFPVAQLSRPSELIFLTIGEPGPSTKSMALIGSALGRRRGGTACGLILASVHHHLFGCLTLGQRLEVIDINAALGHKTWLGINSYPLRSVRGLRSGTRWIFDGRLEVGKLSSSEAP